MWPIFGSNLNFFLCFEWLSQGQLIIMLGLKAMILIHRRTLMDLIFLLYEFR
jgi:hypothetical protein